MEKVQICNYNSSFKDELLKFFEKAFNENNRILDLEGKDIDLLNLESNYLKNGEFWILVHHKRIIGTIAIRKLSNCYEIRRFFILTNYQSKGYGECLLQEALKWAYFHNVQILKAATMKDGCKIHGLLSKYGFYQIGKYNGSTADIFWALEISANKLFKQLLSSTNYDIKTSLVLNPTENFPDYEDFDTKLIEGLYVSERYKNKNDIVVFGGRNRLIDLYDFTKELWKSKLHAEGIDLKTLSGLNAHLVFFLCLAQRGDKILLLPEIAGGHFSTETMLKRIGMQVIHFAVDMENHCVDIEKTKEIIDKEQPKFIFVDRSEGLVYEDFSWIAYYDGIKVFDASQYLCQILDNTYTNPFDIGFDFIISSLHKNYPGPQKSIIAAKESTSIWQEYLIESKVYISNTHPENVFRSLIPLLDDMKLHNYSQLCMKCAKRLNECLAKENVPVVTRPLEQQPTLHIWILPATQEKCYRLFSVLESLKILVNYRKLPYGLGFGLRLGVSAAVQQGLREHHIPELARIIRDAYNGVNVAKLSHQTNKLIKHIIAK